MTYDDAQLSAYLAGDLPAEEETALAAALDRDPQLRERLQRLQRLDALLADMPDPEPSASFSRRLRAAVDDELDAPAAREMLGRSGVTGLREARRRNWSPWRSLGVAAAAAAAVLVVGVGAGLLLRSGGAGPTAETAAGDGYTPQVPVVTTDNDYDDVQLQRLAVNVDTQFVVPPDLTSSEAAELQSRLVAQLRAGDLAGALSTGGDDAGAQEAQPAAPAEEYGDAAADDQAERDAPAAENRGAAGVDAPGCLDLILEETEVPIVPVYVEVAAYQDEPAVIYTFATEDPQTGRYDRIEVWAMSRRDCHTLQFTQYDRGD